MIILDLEWNRSYDKKKLNEILQIGAVRIPCLGGNISDTFNLYIKPVVHKKLDRWAKTLPGAPLAKQSRIRFPEAMERFRQWCGQETVCAMWGSDDLRTLADNCVYWGLPPLEMEQVYDFQSAFSRVAGAGGQVALWKAVEYCGLPASFTFHDALHDAMYTALVSGWLTAASLEKPVRDPRRALSLSALEFPKQPRYTLGPLPTAQAVLDARSGRRVPCPVCGQICGISSWYPGRQGQNYAIFACPDHGRFLCCLSLIRLETGLWRGRRTVPRITEQLARQCAQMMENKPYLCKGGRKRRRKRRKKRES